MNLENKLRFKGFTGFQLKMLALLLMLLDHIHYIFEYTNKIPLAFSWLGRLSAGLFLFTMVEGYKHSSNRKKYFKRIYLMSVFMMIVKYALQSIPSLQRPDGFIPQNGIFQTFVILILMFKAIDLIKDKKILKGVLLLLSPFILSYALLMPIQLINNINLKNTLSIIATTFIPSPFLAEGGIFLIAEGLILYIFKDKRKTQAIGFFLFHFLWMTLVPIFMMDGLTLKLMFTEYYEWMGAFAALAMLFYNGEKGRSMKKLFYIFYPAHIYILYALSLLIYK